MKKQIKKMGFWSKKRHPSHFVNKSWKKKYSKTYKTVLLYIEKSKTYHGKYKGFARCRICKKILGFSDMITPDGKWVFPERYEHYLKKHSVKPHRDAFIEDAVLWMMRKKKEKSSVVKSEKGQLRVIRFFGTHKDVYGYAVFRKKDVPGTKSGDLIKWGQANAILFGLTKKSAIEHRKRLEKEARERIKKKRRRK